MSAPAASAREDRLQRIAAVLASLTLLPDQSADSIQDCAERLLIHSRLTSFNDLPRANAGTTKQAIAELDQFEKLSASLIDHVYQMHGPALTALRKPRRRHPFVVASDLRVLVLAASVKMEELRSAPPSKPPGPPSKNKRVPRERQRKRQAADVTEAAAEVFERLTGKRATIHYNHRGRAAGPFFRFLDSLFRVLEIKADAEAQGRAHMELGRPK